jgi:hypothetical protein
LPFPNPNTQFKPDLTSCSEKIKEAGGSITSVEISLFELLRVAEGGKFKEINRIVK